MCPRKLFRIVTKLSLLECLTSTKSNEFSPATREPDLQITRTVERGLLQATKPRGSDPRRYDSAASEFSEFQL